MAIYLFSQILKFAKYSIKLIEKLSRRHLINSSDVFVIKGFTVADHILKMAGLGLFCDYCFKDNFVVFNQSKFSILFRIELYYT